MKKKTNLSSKPEDKKINNKDNIKREASRKPTTIDNKNNIKREENRKPTKIGNNIYNVKREQSRKPTKNENNIEKLKREESRKPTKIENNIDNIIREESRKSSEIENNIDNIIKEESRKSSKIDNKNDLKNNISKSTKSYNSNKIITEKEQNNISNEKSIENKNNELPQLNDFLIDEKKNLKESQIIDNEKDNKSLYNNNITNQTNGNKSNINDICNDKKTINSYHNLNNENSDIESKALSNKDNDNINASKNKKNSKIIDLQNKSKSKEEGQQIKEGSKNETIIHNNDIHSKTVNESEETKKYNKIIEMSDNISDKNKKLMKSLLTLLDQKYENIKDSKDENNFIKTLNDLEKKEKNKTLELVDKKRKRIFQFKLNNDIKNSNLNNRINNKLFGIQSNINEEKYQNINNNYINLVHSDIKKQGYFTNKYFNDYVDGKCPNLKILEQYKINNNKNENKKNNILYHSLDKIYTIKKKNDFNLLSERSHKYDCYNYKIIMNSIDDRLKSIKNNKKNLKKYNSDLSLEVNELKLIKYSIIYNESNDKRLSRHVRIKNIFNQIKEGINSIKNKGNQRKELKRFLSEYSK